MIVTKTSTLTGKLNTMDVPITQNEIDYWKSSGRLIQDVFPNLTKDQREFLMSGATPEEWADVFGTDEDD